MVEAWHSIEEFAEFAVWPTAQGGLCSGVWERTQIHAKIAPNILCIGQPTSSRSSL